MKDFLNNLNPIRKVAGVIFAIGSMRGTLTYRINIIEKQVEKYDSIQIEIKLAQIQTDLEWIKSALVKIKE